MSAIDNAIKHFESIDIQEIEVPEWGDGNEPLKVYAKPITLSETSRLLKMAQNDDVYMNDVMINEFVKRNFLLTGLPVTDYPFLFKQVATALKEL